LDDLYVEHRGCLKSCTVTAAVPVDSSLLIVWAQSNGTKLVWIETPTNPLLKITEIRAISSLTHRHKLILLVDNTFATPFLQRPLDLGADIVLHSVTKYIAGHADTVGGVVMTSNDAHYERMKFHQNAAGAVMGPFDAFLTMRGVKTLALRVERQCENAAFGKYLEQHPKVRRMIYRDDSHPQKKIAERRCVWGGIISLRLSGLIRR
jgi:cystathionine gamma-lyase